MEIRGAAVRTQRKLWIKALFVGLSLLLVASPAMAQKKGKKKLSLAELAALEWKLEQASKALTTADNPTVRRKAVNELKELQDPRGTKPLALALREDPDPGVRLAAAEALATVKSPETLGLLRLTAKADPEKGVREAAEALTKDYPKRMKEAALELKPRRFRKPRGKISAKKIKKILASPSGDARMWAIRKLRKKRKGLKKKARAALLKKHLRKDPSARVRVEAAQLLAKLRKKKALTTLIGATEDGDPSVRFELARVLAEFNDPGALSVIQKLAASDPNETVRAEAKDLLEPSTEVGRRLLRNRITKLQSANPADRIEALNSLAGFTHWRAMVPMSCALLNDKSPLVRTAATKVLPGMHDTSVLTALRVAAVIEPDPKLKRTVRKIIGQLAKQVNGLIRQLKDDDPQKRILAARALGQGGYPPAVKPLIAALKDKDPRVRLVAAKGLTGFASDKAKDALKVLTADKNARIRQVVDDYFTGQKALQKWRKFYKDPRRIVTWTIDNDPVRRVDAAIALGVSGADGTDGAMAKLLLKDKDERVRLAAAWALVLMGTERAENALRMAAEEDKSKKVRLTARKYMVISKVSRQDLVTQLQDEDPSVRLDAAEALSLMANRQVLPYLVRAALCDPEPNVRAASLRGLARVRTSLARTVITVTMNRDPVKDVRRQAMVMHILAGKK
jgi:HEAT repeat protein